MSDRKRLARAQAGDPAPVRPARAGGRVSRRGDGKVELGSLNARVGYFVRRFQVWIFQDFIRTLAAEQIRPAQYSVLVLIAANAGLSQSGLAEALGIERARLVRLLDELEARGLTVRLPSTVDRRSHALFLTPGGRKALERIETLVARHEANVVKRIGSTQRKTLMRILQRFG